jgi:hypothetical protein
MEIRSSEDLAVTNFELSQFSRVVRLFPTVSVWNHIGNTGSSVGFSVDTNTPDSTSKSDRHVFHVHIGSGPGSTLNIERVDTFSVVDVVTGGGSPNLLMITARDLFEFTVGLSPMSVILPRVTVWVVVIDTSSEVDQMVGISGPDATVVTHGDVEEAVGLLVEDIRPSVTLWSGFGNAGSVVGFSFSGDTDELRVVS